MFEGEDGRFRVNVKSKQASLLAAGLERLKRNYVATRRTGRDSKRHFFFFFFGLDLRLRTRTRMQPASIR